MLRNMQLTPFVAKRSDYRQKHSVIPTRVMKILLKECEDKLVLAEKHFEQWAQIQTALNSRISNLGNGHFNRDTYIDALSEDESSQLDALHIYFDSIRRYVFILVLGV